MVKSKKSKDYISLQEATKCCQHSQEYLSLRARQKKLKSVKLGRNWFTKKEWLEDYLKKTQEYNEKQKIRKQIEPPENLPVENSNQPFALDQFVAQEETKVPVRVSLPRFHIDFDFLAENKLFNSLVLVVVFILTAAWTVFVVKDVQKNEEISEIVADWRLPIEEVYMSLGQKVIEISEAFDFAVKENFIDMKNFYSSLSNYAYGPLGGVGEILAREAQNLRLALQIVSDYSQIQKTTQTLSFYTLIIGEAGDAVAGQIGKLITGTFSFVIKNTIATYQALANVSSSELLKNLFETFSEYGKWLNTSIKNQLTLFLSKSR